MVQTLHPVIAVDGEDFVVDNHEMLMSNPPKYNAFSLKDRRKIYVDTMIKDLSRFMYPQDFLEFLYGKQKTSYNGNCMTISYDDTIKVEPVVHHAGMYTDAELQMAEAQGYIEELDKKLSALTKERDTLADAIDKDTHLIHDIESKLFDSNLALKATRDHKDLLQRQRNEMEDQLIEAKSMIMKLQHQIGQAILREDKVNPTPNTILERALEDLRQWNETMSKVHS